jgi:hypothetical protein
MFSPFLFSFLPTHPRPSHSHPPRPLNGRPESRGGSAFPHLAPHSSDLCVLCVSALSSFSRFTLFTLPQNNLKLNPLFSYSSTLFKKECFHNPFPVNHFRTLLQNTRGVSQESNLSSPRFRRFAPNPFTIRTYAKPTRNPFTIRTSKTQDLKSFRMNTYEKKEGGPPAIQILRPPGSPPS